MQEHQTIAKVRLRDKRLPGRERNAPAVGRAGAWLSLSRDS